MKTSQGVKSAMTGKPLVVSISIYTQFMPNFPVPRYKIFLKSNWFLNMPSFDHLDIDYIPQDSVNSWNKSRRFKSSEPVLEQGINMMLHGIGCWQDPDTIVNDLAQFVTMMQTTQCDYRRCVTSGQTRVLPPRVELKGNGVSICNVEGEKLQGHISKLQNLSPNPRAICWYVCDPKMLTSKDSCIHP